MTGVRDPESQKWRDRDRRQADRDTASEGERLSQGEGDPEIGNSDIVKDSETGTDRSR